MRIEGSAARTTASDDRSCQRCDEAIRGLRRNGYCSDACRMADRREQIDRRRRELLSRLKQTINEIAADWFPGRSEEQP